MKRLTQVIDRHAQSILRDLGELLHVPGIMAVASLPICIWFKEFYAIDAFLWTAIASFALGQLLYRLFRPASNTHLRHAMLTVALGWGIIPLFGAIPFWAIATHLAADPAISQAVLTFQVPWNAIFESYSGFTTTGLTIALHPSQLPHSLQWWRSLMQWIGGVGVIVLLLSILEPSTDAYELYYAEGREKQIGLTIASTVKRIWWIYLLYTALSIVLLAIVGMPWWEAINHGLTGIATAGFSTQDDSMGSYGPIVRLAMIVIMIAGAISFPVHYQLLRERRLSVLWKDIQHRAFWILLTVGAVVLFLEIQWFSDSFHGLDPLFQWVAALSTCGFETVDLQTWSPGAKLLLSVGMVFGGTAGSTTGGLKLNRVVALYKGIVWRFRQFFLQPHQLMSYRLNNKVLTEEEASRQVQGAGVLAMLWIGLLWLGIFGLLHVVEGYSPIDVMFEVTSALGSAGLSTGITTPDLHWFGKLILILFMWMGRLEIVPVLFLFSFLLKSAQRIVYHQWLYVNKKDK